MEATIQRFFIPALAAVAVAAALIVARAVLFRVIRAWADRTTTRLDDIAVASFKTPSLYWCVAIGLSVGVSMTDIPDRHIASITKLIHVLVILSVTIAAANLAGAIFTDYVRKSSLPIPTTGLAFGIVKGSIFVVGFLVILSVLGISITPIITALGVGGLAVALALQDTLANLFAGIHILVERSIRVGDFIRLESGQEGYVEDITWRTTRVRMLPNNVVIIPNAKIAQSTVTNYYLPEKRMSLLIPIGVDYASDPEAVERILVEEAVKAAGSGEIPGLLSDPPPFVRFIPGFGDSSLDFTLICQVAEFV
ncbi:MAG: mechanosensitive ion channel family protein, partial [Gemmatimonadota bacterium]